VYPQKENIDTPEYMADERDLETFPSQFNVPVSCFPNVFSKMAVTSRMDKWLRSIVAPNSEIENVRMGQVLEYRRTFDPELKKRIPIFTPGAQMNHRDKSIADPPQLHTMTEWMQFDVDAKDNPNMTDAALLRDEIAKIVYVAFCSLSTSGNGVWGLVKVKDIGLYREHFEQLKIDFASVGITLDPSKGGNPTDPRFYTYDPDAYIAPQFRTYDRLGGSTAPDPHIHVRPPQNVTTDSWERVNEVVAIIRQRGLDIAPDYDAYMKIGLAFAREFGEAGRDLFHTVCQFSPKYKHAEADRQYSDCIRAKGGGITIGTFFYYFKRAMDS
jgi:hypothetical protein